MAAYNQEMFAKISEAMKSDKSQQSNIGNILRLKPGNTYSVRLLPNIEKPKKTLFHYYSHGWNSLSTGQYISAVSPSTWGERDPIDEAKFKLSKHGNEQEKEDSRLLTRRENWLINVYVVSDPTDSENNGKVKILRFGKQLNKIIMSAIEGEDSDEFGARVFDLSKDGCSLKIKVEEQGGYSTYVSSRFASPQKITGLSDDESINQVYNNTYDLESVFTVKSYEELKDMLNEHFYCKDPDDTSVEEESVNITPNPTQPKLVSVDDDDDDLDYGKSDENDKVKDLLANMDI
tara:strand:+ start:3166 stop:4035 length:870 start_codon:yes stop_codon:yes gene_type:complete